jgi:hypothetical protein
VNFGTCKVMLLLLLIVICCDAISQVQWFSDCWNFFFLLSFVSSCA